MRKKLFRFALFLFASGLFLQAWAVQSSSPEEALIEMATASNIADVIKHLPLKVQQFVEKLPRQQRASMEEKLLLSRNLEQEGGTLTRVSDGSWELMEKAGESKITISLKKTFVSGIDALVQLEVKTKDTTTGLMIGMRYEENEWRVQEAGEWRAQNLESQFLPKKGGEEDASPAATLRMLNTSLLAYISTYPEAGYPLGLEALSGEENQEPSADHAMILNPDYLQQPLIQNGYEFRYLRTARDHYQITAVPVRFAEGMKNFFTDETAVVRSTRENRPATANDPPVE